MRIFELGLFSRFRSELMGIAAIMIIVCHMPAHGVDMPAIASKIFQAGGVVCDIFLFLSGFGLSVSLSKYRFGGGKLLSWYKKRYFRIIVPYLCISIPCCIIPLICGSITFHEYILNVSTISYWINGYGLWFIAMLLPLYFLTPFLYRLSSCEYGIILLGGIVVLSWIFGSINLGFDSLRYVQFVLVRIPLYLIGLIMAPHIMDGRKIPFLNIIVIWLCLFLVWLSIRLFLDKTLSFFWIEAILLLIILPILLTWIKAVWVHRALRFMGSISLESYCTNVLLLAYFSQFSWSVNGVNINPGNWTYYIVGSAICIFISYVVNIFCKTIIKI